MAVKNDRYRPLSRLGAGLCLPLKRLFLEKRLYRAAPDLGRVPNPLSREYLLLIQQHARLEFVDAVIALRQEGEITRSLERLYRYLASFLALKATTAIVDSLLVEEKLAGKATGVPQ
jgi:hypothetical protein